MTLEVNGVRLKAEFEILALDAQLYACASTGPDYGSPDLKCPIANNFVNSRESGDLMPLQYDCTPAQTFKLLRATVATFPEATVVRADPLGLQLIFTTPIGFRDEVDSGSTRTPSSSALGHGAVWPLRLRQGPLSNARVHPTLRAVEPALMPALRRSMSARLDSPEQYLERNQNSAPP